MKLRLQSTESTRGSASLKRLALALTEKVGYKVFRSTQPHARRRNLKYGQSVNKLDQYKWFKEQGLSALEFTTDAQEAVAWQQEGNHVFGRKYLNSSCGKGIVIFLPFNEEGLEPNGQAHGCPVYTKYKKKKREFRVHVFQDKVVAVREKKRRSGYEGQSDPKIRNLANGYVFCSCDNEPAGIRELALAASKVVASDFKGVDIGFNAHHNDLFIIEVNSAPGIEGSNINEYVSAILG